MDLNGHHGQNHLHYHHHHHHAANGAGAGTDDADEADIAAPKVLIAGSANI